MSFTLIHYWVGYAIVGSWAVVGGWSLALRFLRFDETPTFWRAVSVAQILLMIQLLVGVVLLALGRLPAGSNWFDNIFHILYGIVFPVIVLFYSHKWSREGRYDPYTVFALTGLVLFGLTARAWMTGAGM